MTKPVRYLLDTNILSDLVHHPAGPVAARIREVGANAVCTSVVVVCELHYGALKRGSERLSQRVSQLIAMLDVVDLDDEITSHYAEIRCALESEGRPIGANDLLIAAQARARGLVVVTANRREFDRVPGLRVENWLE